MRALLTGLFLALLPGLVWAQNKPPEAIAGPDQNIFLNELVLVSGSATDADGDAIVAWHWTFDSAPPGSNASFDDPGARSTFFVPDFVGTYVVTLVVFDGTDYSQPSSLTVTVALNQPPTAVVRADVLSGTVPLTVHFDGSGSSDPEGAPLSYAWSFGDASPSVVAESPTHVFVEPGTYFVSLLVTDKLNNQDEDYIVIEVSPPNNSAPAVSPAATPTSGTAPLYVSFNAHASDADNDPLSYVWDFGDPLSTDNTSTLSNPSHLYGREGSYVATVRVSDGKIAIQAQVSVVVSPSPKASVSKVHLVEAGEKGARKGQISLWADVGFGLPAAEDVISVVFDGVALFSAPFGSFKANEDSTAFLLVERDLLVRFDPAAGQLFVQRRRANLFGSDFTDGVTAKFLWGKQAAIDEFAMSANPGGVWSYKRDAVAE